MTKPRPTPSAAELGILKEAGVPIISILDACRSCDDPCEEASERNIFDTIDVDYDSNLLGSVKTAGRTVIVATGKSDWPHSVTDEKPLYAHKIAQAYDSHLFSLPPSASAPSNGQIKRRCVKGLEGMEDGLADNATERKKQITILCGSMQSYEPYSHDSADGETAMVFPDYKLVANLPSTSAQDLVGQHLSPRQMGRIPPPSASKASLQAYTLPYYAVLLVCSHKKRDKRCHLTAGPLIDALSHSIEALGPEWHVDTSGNDEHLLEDSLIKDTDTEEGLSERLKGLRAASEKTVGIFKVSHVGGHRYSGQVMVWLPNGVGIHYGRVRSEDCSLIVQETLINGKILTELLRGGTGIAGRADSVLEW